MQRPDLDAASSEWLVYADSLLVAGDRRGELITLFHNSPDADAFVRAHGEVALGGAARAHAENAYRLIWKHGFIDSAEIRVTPERSADAASWVKALLAAPAASELRSLAIVGVTDDRTRVDAVAAVKALTATALPASCKTLAFVDERATRSRTQVSREFGMDENLVSFGSVGDVWKLPHVEHLRFEVGDVRSHDSIGFGTIDGTRVKSLVIRTLRWGDGYEGTEDELAAALAETDWPVLEDLELRLCETFCANIPFERQPYVAVYSDRYNDEEEDGDNRYDEEAEDGDNEGVDWGNALEPLMKKLVTSPLRRLALTSFDSPDALLDMLKKTGLPPTLRVLDLSDSSLSAQHAAWMRKEAKLFGQLAELRLERTGIDVAAAAQLHGIGPAIVHSHTDDTPTYRYVVGME